MPLIYNPLIQITDANGDAYSGAKLTVFDAGTVDLRQTFSDKALATPNANPLSADAAGRFGPFYLAASAIDYKLKFETSTDVHIVTQDNVPVSALDQATMGLIFYPTSDEEDSEGVTPVNFFKNYGNLLRYGTNTTPGTTDMTTAINNWIKVAYHQQAPAAYAPAGHYAHASTITLATAGNDQRVKIFGDGCGDKSSFTNSAPAGTVFEYTGAAGNGWKFGDGSTTNINAFQVEDIAFWATTTGIVVHFDRVQSFNKLRNLFVGNKGTGNGLIFEDSWVSSIHDIYCSGKDTVQGIGFQFVQSTLQAGIASLLNISGDTWQYGVVIGHQTQGTGFNVKSISGLLHGLNCDEGVVIGEAVGESDFIIWEEGNATCGLRIFNEVTNCDFRVYSTDPDATEASIVIGKSGGTALENKVARCTIRPSIDNINSVGIQLYQSVNMVDNVLDRPVLNPKTGGVGDGIALGVANGNGLKIIRPQYGNLANNTTGSIALVDLVETTGQDGLSTHNSPHTFTGEIQLNGRSRNGTVTSLDDTGTPSVSAGNLFKTGGTTAITDFDDGVVGQTIRILAAHSVTITDGAPIILAGGANFTMVATDTLTLTMFDDQIWQEVARSVN